MLILPRTTVEAGGVVHDRQTEYGRQRRGYWNNVASDSRTWAIKRYYHQRLGHIYSFLIPPGMRVLELGCGQGNLLSALRPAYGVGVDWSAVMIDKAQQLHPQLSFLEGDVHALDLGETFDFIVCSDLVNDLYDVQQVFEAARRHSHSGTKIILNTYSRLWEIPRRFAEKLRISRPHLEQNWLTSEDVSNLLYLADFETFRTWHEILWPIRTPGLNSLANKYLVRFAPFRWFALANFLIARPRPVEQPDPEPIVSVIVAARNEEGNIPEIFARVPEMGGGTELIFVEGNSQDDTYGAIEREMTRHARLRVKLFKQPGQGKGDAVRTGFANAAGELLMILDADLTVPPEDLPRFYESWRSGKAEFVNGVRLVYPMEERAMRFFNLIGNRFFSLAFTWLLSQSVKDTLCGTKALSKRHYETIAANRSYFGEMDPFGDFDLIFGAAKYNLKIVDLPIRYRERVRGESNIQRWSHGWLLLRMVVLAMRRIKFV